MTEDTIPEDVLEEVESVDNTENEETKPVDKREDAIKAMAEQRALDIAAEVAELEPTEEAVDDTEQLIKVKVDGEELELSLEDVVKGYQKDATGSQRLTQAAEERKALDAEKEAFKLEQEQHKEQLATQEAKPEQDQQLSKDVDNDFVEHLRDAMDDLSVGSEEEQLKAATAIKELLGRGDNPTIQEDTIVSQAAQQATESALAQIDFNEAKKKFVDDYQDIASDATLYQMATNAYYKAAPQSQTHEEAFKKAGDSIRQWRDGLVNNQKDEVSEKIALKEQLPKEPVTSGKRAAPKPEEKEPTPSDIIAGMRAGRGQ